MEHLLDERLLSGSSGGGAFAASAGCGVSGTTVAAATTPSLTTARLAPGNIRSLILEKEKELHDINEYRIRTLEALLRDKESAANSYKQKFAKLQEDFKYNLKLLEGRDEELALYDSNFATLKGVLRDREAEVSELKAQVADVHADLQQSQARCREQETFFQQKLKDARAQMDAARWQFDDELRRQKDDVAAQSRKTERRLREQEEDLEAQRRELSVTFDELLRARESEFKQALDQAQSKNRDLELKLKSVSRESDASRDRLAETKAKLENLQTLLTASEKELKAAEWQLADVRAAKDAKIQDLERDVAALQDVKQALLDEYEGKMAELLQSLHSVEKAFVQQKKQFDDELQHHMRRKDEELQTHTLRLESKIASLTSKLREQSDTLEHTRNELKQVKWDSDDQLLAKDRDIERVRSELQDAEDQRQALVADYKQQLWQSEREVLAAHEKLADASTQLQVQREKEKVLRQELVESSEKLEDVKHEIVTLNLRWENKWQDHEQELSARSELRVRELTAVKERLLAEKQATEERLVHAENELQRLRAEVYALRSDSRIAESFGAQYHSANSSQERAEPWHRSREARSVSGSGADTQTRMVAPSPLWSEDNGELSPIAGMSPLLTDTPPKRENSSAAERIAGGGSGDAGSAPSGSLEALQLENAKLRDLIHEMRDALTQQASDLTGSAGTTAVTPPRSDDLATELRESQKRCVLLEARLVQLQAASTDGGHPSGGTGIAGDTANSAGTALSDASAQLIEARRTIEQQAARIAELEAQLQVAQTAAGPTPLAADRVLADTHVNELKRKLVAAESDIERLVRERSQLMELSNQLRAELRALRDHSGSRDVSTSDFAGKKDFENLVAELSRSLEESRLHNKTLKKELRRMLKQQVVSAQQGVGGPAAAPQTELTPRPRTRDEPDDNADGTEARRRTTSVASSAAVTDVTSSEGRRRSSTLSMMRALEEPPPPQQQQSSATTQSRTPSSRRASGGDFDAELLSLVRSKRPSDADRVASPFRTERRRSSAASSAADSAATPRRGRSASTTSRPRSIRERDDEEDDDAELNDDDDGDDNGEWDDSDAAPSRRASREDAASSTRSRRLTASSAMSAASSCGPKTALSSLFQRDRLDSAASVADSSTTAKVSDARLRLQQDILSREMLQLAGKKAERSASLASFATARSSDRETPSQRSAIKKLKELQSRRSEMVADRKRVRNYRVAT